MLRRCLQVFLLTIWWFATPTPVNAQFWPSLGGRVLSRDGKWLTPVANPLLSSDENDHLRRGSVNAWDLTVPLGTPVYPMAAGTVEYAGCNNAGGYGCWVIIRHEDGYSSIYAHLMDEGGGSVWVKTGERVTPWTVLGRVGWTGQTSFGPHVHWEIRHNQEGRLRNDRFFSRSGLAYCKFCAASEQQARAQTEAPTGIGLVASRLFSIQALLALALIGLALLLFMRPEVAVLAMQSGGRFFGRIFRPGGAVESADRWRVGTWLHLLMILVAPALLCGTVTAVGVWMADAGVTPTALIAYWRYGAFPLLGGGYQSGAKYGAVWGMPCTGVGTLGKSCTVDEIMAAGMAWPQEIGLLSGAAPTPVVIPRFSARFTLREARQLLTAMHQRDGLVIVDVSHDFALARQVIDELTSYGLDGVAIDLEYVKDARAADVRALADYMAESRRAARLEGEGVLVLWNVFHNLDASSKLAVDGVRIVPIFTGYGNTATKIAGLQRTQKLFAVGPSDSGLMAFDNR
jgi:hypothetical protein